MTRLLALLALAASPALAPAALIQVTISGTFDPGHLGGQPYSASLVYNDQNVIPASILNGTATAYLPGTPGINTVTTFGDILPGSVSVTTPFPPPPSIVLVNTLVTYTNGQLQTVRIELTNSILFEDFRARADFPPGGGPPTGLVVYGGDLVGSDTDPTITVRPLDVPEPGTLAVFGLLAAGGLAVRRRKA